MGQWSKNFPTEPGWYWARIGESDPYPEYIDAEGIRLSRIGGEYVFFQWWSEPIPVPPYDATEVSR